MPHPSNPCPAAQEDTLKKHAHDTRPRPSAGLGRYKRLETRLSYQTTYGETFAAKAVDPAAPAAPPSPEPAAAAAAVAPVAAVPAPTVAWPKESDAAAAGEEGDPAVRHVPPKRRTLREHVGERHAKDKAHRCACAAGAVRCFVSTGRRCARAWSGAHWNNAFSGGNPHPPSPDQVVGKNFSPAPLAPLFCVFRGPFFDERNKFSVPSALEIVRLRLAKEEGPPV